MDGLLRYTAEGRLRPALAEGFSISDDGLTYTFALRQDVRYHNGEPFSGEDFVAAWELSQDREFGALSTLGWQKVESVDLPDEATLVVTTTEPYAPFLSTVATTYLCPRPPWLRASPPSARSSPAPRSAPGRSVSPAGSRATGSRWRAGTITGASRPIWSGSTTASCPTWMPSWPRWRRPRSTWRGLRSDPARSRRRGVDDSGTDRLPPRDDELAAYRPEAVGLSAGDTGTAGARFRHAARADHRGDPCWRAIAAFADQSPESWAYNETLRPRPFNPERRRVCSTRRAAPRCGRRAAARR